jgi:TPR repeat protein
MHIHYRTKCDEAKLLLQESSQRGCIDSFFHLGSIYENGLDGHVDLGRATRYYKEAAEASPPHAKAAYTLAMLYRNKVKEEDLVEGENKEGLVIKYLRLAAKLGHAEACFDLAKLIDENKVDGETPKTAVRLLREAANQDLHEALLYLGKCYLAGKGVEKSYLEVYNYMV